MQQPETKSLIDRLPWFLGLALCGMVIYQTSHLPLWIQLTSGFFAFLPASLGFSLLQKRYLRWKKRGSFPALGLSLVCMLLLLLFYILEFYEVWPGSLLWILIFGLWVGWSLWQRASASLLAALIGVLSLCLMLGILRLSSVGSTALLYLHTRYEELAFEKQRREAALRWQTQAQASATVFSLRRGNADSSIMEIRTNKPWILHAKAGSAASPDYPVPGPYLGSLSLSGTDPWALPSLSFFQIRAKDSQTAVELLFQKARRSLEERRLLGSLSNLRSSGKIFVKITHTKTLKGIAFDFLDTITEKKTRLAFFLVTPLPSKTGDASKVYLAMMSLEEPQTGFPLHPALLELMQEANWKSTDNFAWARLQGFR